MAWLSELLEISISGLTMEESQIFNILIEILSEPWDLWTSRERIRLSKEPPSIVKEDKEVWGKGKKKVKVKYCHYQEENIALKKWELNKQALALKSVIWVLLWTKWGITGIFLSQNRDFSMVQ